jgi:enhancing lycopene biosynthesis protein 2
MMTKKPRIAVILSGCGVYDGSEIQETVLTLLALDKAGTEVSCFAPDIVQHHVINHLTGIEMPESRNVLTESARIARGAIKPLSDLSIANFDALVLPGGFGVAKNFTQWAFEGPQGSIIPELKLLIQECIALKKPIAALCMAPTTLAKAMEGTGISLQLTVGSTAAKSPYDIDAISDGMKSIGVIPEMKTVQELCIDKKHKIVTSPCYMMDASISEINAGIEKCISELLSMLK